MKENELTINDLIEVFKTNFLLLASVLLITSVLSYLVVFFFIDEEYDSTVLVIPQSSGNDVASLGGISSLIGNMNLPFDVSGANSELTNLFNSIIYSRTTIDHLMNKYNLDEMYGIDPDEYDDGIDLIRDKIEAETNDNNAYEISVRTKDKKTSAELANYLIEYLNNRVLEINVNKAKSNRTFLEKRYLTLISDIETLEDSLTMFQEESKIFEPETQINLYVETLTTFEVMLIQKQIEFETLEEANTNINILNQLKTNIQSIKTKIDDLKLGNTYSGIYGSLDEYPEQVKQYLRLYQKLLLNQKIMEFVLPLYEQAKFEEEKSIPVLQTLDYAIEAQKKSFPPRTIFALAISLPITFFVFLIVLNRKQE